MLKSVNQLVNEVCNSKCNMCMIWALRKDPNQMTPQDFGKLYARKEFSQVTDLCISGGEPTLRRDLQQVMDTILSHLPKLSMLFLSTNCSFPDRVLDFMKANQDRADKIFVCASLEGDRETHKEIRGVDTHDKVIQTLLRVRDSGIPNASTIISSTLQPRNANIESLDYIEQVAARTGSTYSFRPVMMSDTFYRNEQGQTDGLHLSAGQIQFVLDYIKNKKMHDPFMVVQKAFLEGRTTVMGDRNGGIECLAGDISVFIKSDGKMYPCINSTRVIGDKERGLYSAQYQLGSHEKCPCCTECQIYPMLNFAKYGSRGGTKK